MVKRRFLKGKWMMRKKIEYTWLFLLVMLVSCANISQQTTATPENSALPTLSPEITITTIASPESTASQRPPVTTVKATWLADQDGYVDLRLAMVEDTISSRDIVDRDVIRAMQMVPRHIFVPEEYIMYAYADFPLPIGYGQTISQPYIVALMTQLLDLEPGEKVLEIGTGSGYQAAVLVAVGQLEVFSIEIVPELAAQAEENLANSGYDDVHLKADDGYYGWEEQAPFDAIIVTAAPDHLPLPLVEQLTEGGIMVIPIGPPGWYQTLWRITKTEGELVMENMGSVAFVPFTGEGASTP
jgi:protein-L-isoaspartate(D-aspartate) O-methyltransferase